MKKLFFTLLLLLMLVGCAQVKPLTPSPTVPPPTVIPTPTETPVPQDVAAIIERGSIRVGGFNSPSEPLSDGFGQSPQGFEPAIMRTLITDVFGDEFEIEWRPTTVSNGLGLLRDGKIDLLIRNTTHTVSRDADGLWTVPYFLDGQRILVKTDANLTKWADLDGQPVCSDGGSLQDNLIAQMTDNGITVEVVNSSGMSNSMVSERCTAIAHYWSVLLMWGHEYTSMGSETPDWVSIGDLMIGEIDGAEFGYEPLAIGVTPDASGLHEAINAALIAMIEDGRWQAIYDQWIHDPAPWTPADLLTAAPADR